MSLRIFNAPLLIALALLGGCQQGTPSADTGNESVDNSLSPVEAAKRWVNDLEDKRPRVKCAVGAGAALAPDCRLNILEVGGQRIYVVSLPDGGFRQIVAAPDGALSLVAGAEPSRTSHNGRYTELIVGEERYVLPLDTLGVEPEAAQATALTAPAKPAKPSNAVKAFNAPTTR